MKKLEFNKEKIINILKNKKILLIAFLLIWIIVTSVTINNYKSSLGMKSSGNDCETIDVFELNNEKELRQTITLKHDVNSVSIKFATYARKNKGVVNIKVVGVGNGIKYLEKAIDVNDILDNAFMTISLDEKIDVSKQKQIEIIITSNSIPGEAVGVYYTEKTFEQDKLSINNESIDFDIKVRFLREDETLSNFNIFIITTMIIGFSIIIIFIIFSNKEEHIFAIMALIFGIIFTIVITPMSPPDEQRHYEFSYEISSIIMGKGDDYMKIDREYQDYTNYAGHLNVSSAYENFKEEFNKKYSGNKGNNTIAEGSDVKEATYSLCYIPQSIAITIGRILHLNMLKTFYLGRLFNLICYCICIYVSIKKTPMHKTLFGLIATMPIFIQQAASYSYDACLNGLMLVIASFLFDWLNKEGTIEKKEVIELFLVILFVTPLKSVYSLFVLCFVFVPYTSFGSKKNKVLTLLLLIMPVLIHLTVLLLPYFEKLFRNMKENSFSCIDTSMNTMSLNTIIKEISQNNTDNLYSISYITKNWKEVILLYLHTIRSCIKIWFYESLGRSLSGVSLVLPLKLVHIMSYIVLLAAIVKEKYNTSIKVRISIVLICIAIGVSAMTGMLLTWTNIGSDIIQGMQGRYFCPLLFFILTIINNPKIYLPKITNRYLMFAQILMMFETVIYVLSYTFVN